MSRWVLFFLLVLVGLYSLGKLRLLYQYYLLDCGADPYAQQADFPMAQTPVDLEDYYDSINNLNKLNGVRVSLVASVSAEADNDVLPIYLIRLGNQHARNKILVLAGMQGNEVAPLISVIDFAHSAQRVLGQELKDVSVDILTPISPHGVLHQSRYTYQGCDINRDFGSFRTQEAQVVRSLLSVHEYDLVLSLHESPRDGFFLITEPHNDAGLDMAIYAQLAEDTGIALSDESLFGLPLRTAGFSPKPDFLMWLQQLFGVETLGYYTNRHAIHLITAESDWKQESLDARSYPHYATIVAAVKALAN